MKNLALLFILAALLASCGSKTDKKAHLATLKKEQEKLSAEIAKLEQEIAAADTGTVYSGTVKDVAVTEIQPAAFSHFIEIQGRVDGDENIGVNPRMPGIVNRNFVKVGDRVTKGQVMAELDAEATKKNLEQVREQLAFASTVYNKQKNLWDQKIGSEIQYLTAKNNKESLEKTVEALEETLDMSKIVSPINGTVEEIPIKLGESVSPGFPAIRVINFSQIKVIADLAEAYATKVKEGDLVKVFFPDYDKEVEARLTFASKYINPINRTFQVEIRLPSPDGSFKANMIAVVKINDYSAKEALSVPVNVLLKSMDGQYVFVATQSEGVYKAHRNPVVVGSIFNGLAEIRTGLKPGDKVVTMGYQDLYEGQAIRF